VRLARAGRQRLCVNNPRTLVLGAAVAQPVPELRALRLRKAEHAQRASILEVP
jgi:hypothetical protein